MIWNQHNIVAVRVPPVRTMTFLRIQAIAMQPFLLRLLEQVQGGSTSHAAPFSPILRVSASPSQTFA